MRKLLIIGHTFPEPTTTAAGGRMMQLIEMFSSEGYQITFVSTAKTSERSVNLDALGVTTAAIELNSDSFNVFVSQLKPTLVLFDRYITEEQFGWRVVEHSPDAVRILDTEDLHFLRKAREETFKKEGSLNDVNLFTNTAKRELASILRCDLSLIISEAEHELLQETFRIPSELLFYLPFLIEELSEATIKQLPKFEERNDFYTIGNLLHAPNVDAVKVLKNEVWPRIREQLPEAKLHIYGAYAPQQILELHNVKEGFLIKGWVADASEIMQKSRVCLAPLRFGAGLKGKIIDAMSNGTPSVTTPIGMEGIGGDLSFSGRVADDFTEFAKASVELYTNKNEWLQTQENGYRILAKRFGKNLFSKDFLMRIEYLITNLDTHRKANFIGQILQHQSMQSTKYMSKWIQAKTQEN